jgi:hypothetical protein
MSQQSFYCSARIVCSIFFFLIIGDEFLGFIKNKGNLWLKSKAVFSISKDPVDNLRDLSFYSDASYDIFEIKANLKVPSGEFGQNSIVLPLRGYFFTDYSEEKMDYLPGTDSGALSLTTYHTYYGHGQVEIADNFWTNDLNKLAKFFDRFDHNRKSTKIVMESSGMWYNIYEWLNKRRLDVRLSNPAKTRAIASAKIKTDKFDAIKLADLLRSGYIAEC